MSVSKLVLTSIARPGIETRGKVVGPKDIERTVKEQLGFRQYLSLLAPVNDRLVKSDIKPLRWLVNASQIRELLKALPGHIELSGIKQKFTVDRSLEFDPDSPHERIPYDPVTDMSVVAVRNLLRENKIEPEQIGGFYLATTTANSLDPPPAQRVLAKLIRDKIVSKKVIEGDGGRGGWKTRGINEGCVGSVIALGQIEQDMKQRLLDNPTDHRYAVAVFAAANSIHMKPENPHEIINYGDGAAAALFKFEKDGSGNLIVGEEQVDMKEVDKIVHQFKKSINISFLQRLSRYFNSPSNYMASKKVAKNIADRAPDYLNSFVKENGFQLWDFDHLILSQTSKGVIDRVEFGIAEKIREALGVEQTIRPELKAMIDQMAEESSIILSKEKHLLTTNLFRVVENDRWQELFFKMTPNEIELMNYMALIHQTIVRAYPEHSYTGVASIPMAIAQGVMDKKIDLEKDSIAMVASGLCGRMKGAIKI